MINRRIRWVVAILAALASTGSADPTTTLTPAVDGFVRDGLDRPKDGVPDATLPNSVVQVLNMDRPATPFEDRGVIEFDAGSIGVPVGRAELRLPVFSSQSPYPFTVSVYGYVGDGRLQLDDFTAGTLLAEFAYSGETSVTLDVTSFLQQIQTSRTRYAGFGFRMNVPMPFPTNGWVAFRSVAVPPPSQLVVTPAVPAVPPAGVVMLIVVLGGLGAYALRRRPRAARSPISA